MILPIVAYGNSTLRKKCIEIDKDYSDLNYLIENMWQTMYNAEGVGLAAPQIGLSIRLFIIDANPLIDPSEPLLNEDFKKHVFINPTIIQCRVPINPIIGETYQREMPSGEKIYCE